MRGLDKHLEALLAAHPKAAAEYAKLFAQLPKATQEAIKRRRKALKSRKESDFPTGKVRIVKDFLPPPGQLKIPSKKPHWARGSRTHSSSK